MAPELQRTDFHSNAMTFFHPYSTDVYYNKQWQLRGVLLNFLKLSARKFEFDLKLIRGLMHGQLNTKTGKWSGLHKMVSL